MNTKYIISVRLCLLFVVLSNGGYSQDSLATQDSVNIDSLNITLVDLFDRMDPEKMPWTFISFEISDPDMKINYGQKPIHPFLAEYKRKIQFQTENGITDTLEMSVNYGGRTLIDVYFDIEEKMIIMEDHIGKYFFNLKTKEYYDYYEHSGDEYSENSGEEEKYTHKEYIGRINGTEYPLKFEPKDYLVNHINP